MTTNDGREPVQVRIPADVEREDRLLGGLTARQLALLATPAVVLWLIYLAVADRVPAVVFAVVAVPIGVAAVTITLGRRDGLSLDRLLVAGWRQHRAPRRLVPAPDGVPPEPSFVGVDAGPPLAPLVLPFTGVAADGTVGLGDEGVALVCRASTVNLALRTPAEQQALVAVFARYLNGLPAPVEIVVRSEPVDLHDNVARLTEDAGGLPHPALEAAALAHAGFLAELAERHDLLHRDVLVVLRDPGTDTDAPARLHRRAADTTAALTGAGITVTALDGPETARVLAAALDSSTPARPTGLAAHDAVITGTPR